MTTIRNLMIAGALMLAVTPALAEDAHHPPRRQVSAPAATPQAPAAASGMMGMMMAPERIEGRIAFLRAELRITDAQQPLRNSFADALRSNARDMMGGIQQTESMQGGTAPSLMQRMDGHERRQFPGVNFWSHDAGHLLETMFGWRIPAQGGVAHG